MSRMARDSASNTRFLPSHLGRGTDRISSASPVPLGRGRGGFRAGLTFIEVLIAVALLGVIVVTLMAGLSSITLATVHHRQQTTLDLLVRSDEEYIKSQGYHTKTSGVPYQNIAAAGYAFSAPLVTYWDPTTATFRAANNDNGLQQISVRVTAPGGGTERIILLKVQP